MERAWRKFFWLVSSKIADGIEMEEKENLCLNKSESNKID